MSGVYIKGLKMPESCYSCPLGRRTPISVYCPCCGRDYQNFSNDPDVRLDNCPLILVPSHGGLVDTSTYRDEFMSVVYDELASDQDWTRANRIIDAYDSALVIIPGDKNESVL